MGNFSEELHVQLHRQHHPNNKLKLRKPTKNVMKKNPKITYISSPVMVNAATASEFRAIVQELTGKDSDAGFLWPRDNKELGPIFGRESTVTSNLPTSHSFFVEEAFDFFYNSIVHEFGFDDPFLWREHAKGSADFQPSELPNVIKKLV